MLHRAIASMMAVLHMDTSSTMRTTFRTRLLLSRCTAAWQVMPPRICFAATKVGATL